jgi:hypothetical protein
MSLPTVDDVPEYAMLWLPPFPKSAKPIVLYHDWQSAGVHIVSSAKYTEVDESLLPGRIVRYRELHTMAEVAA